VYYTSNPWDILNLFDNRKHFDNPYNTLFDGIFNGYQAKVVDAEKALVISKVVVMIGKDIH
jgi:hypothetical protein